MTVLKLGIQSPFPTPSTLRNGPAIERADVKYLQRVEFRRDEAEPFLVVCRKGRGGLEAAADIAEVSADPRVGLPTFGVTKNSSAEITSVDSAALGRVGSSQEHEEK